MFVKLCKLKKFLLSHYVNTHIICLIIAFRHNAIDRIPPQIPHSQEKNLKWQGYGAKSQPTNFVTRKNRPL